MKISKKRERWIEMKKEAVDIKRKILRKRKYGANGSYASHRRHDGSGKHQNRQYDYRTKENPSAESSSYILSK